MSIYINISKAQRSFIKCFIPKNVKIVNILYVCLVSFYQNQSIIKGFYCQVEYIKKSIRKRKKSIFTYTLSWISDKM